MPIAFESKVIIIKGKEFVQSITHHYHAEEGVKQLEKENKSKLGE